ncbi:hypothetical protein K0504_15955 [Neiella marina]|uniref:Uncharacterized protein n=1 Tax=Neiella holothuriorum TaxID=2870530 RepID=A0ABS7EJL2_9GAMM|nr:hypothetical protein [Neiella holothuriorum]MBW8192534.1 hypothetical protein [Neiella holothuriorum]
MTEQFSGDDVLQVVENQLADGEPLVVKETQMRLMMTGHDKEEALELIACALTLELSAIAEQGESFNLARYSANLALLPDMPWLTD